jgi:hypothetical protein
VFARQLRARREFLEKELAREKETLESVLKEVGHRYHEAVWMVSLMIAEFETELKWLAEVEREVGKRGKAKKPEYVSRYALRIERVWILSWRRFMSMPEEMWGSRSAAP